jgi:hypothetical protein
LLSITSHFKTIFLELLFIAARHWIRLHAETRAAEGRLDREQNRQTDCFLCPFCGIDGTHAASGNVVCGKCRVSFEIDERGERLFVDLLSAKTSCARYQTLPGGDFRLLFLKKTSPLDPRQGQVGMRTSTANGDTQDGLLDLSLTYKGQILYIPAHRTRDLAT